ncbi:MAG TPA: peptide chain release factor-like protein [Phycisphaerales bacterium]|nr:peptide chain release factor-like protein [Phycisphaerales bacterium]
MPDPFAEPVWRVSAHPTALGDAELLAQCALGRGRTGGPGGQHRNRVATQVVLTHGPTGIAAQAGERRSAEDNKAMALRRLRYALAVEHRTPVSAGEARTELWAKRCSRDGKIVCAERHRDHATLIAEAMDVIAAGGWDVDRAALRLVTTKTQLVKLLAGHPPALAELNERREARGLRRLHVSSPGSRR